MRLLVLRQLYDRAADRLPLLGTPHETAVHFQGGTRTTDEAAEDLARRYVTLSAATGFVCGLPGFATMPLTVPSNVVGVLLLQFHLCATLAALGGTDPRDPDVRERAIACVVGDGVDRRSRTADTDEASGLLGRLAAKLGERGVRFVGQRAAAWIGRTASRSGRGTRSLPLLGGVVGGVTDGYSTWEVGTRGRRAFLSSSKT